MYDLLKTRRSIRKYSSKMVEKDKVDTLIKSILLAPSGHNAKPVEVIYVEDKEILKKLSFSKVKGSKFLEFTPQCFVILGNEDKTDIWIEDSSIAMTIAHLSAKSLGLGSCLIQIRNRKTPEGILSEDYIRDIFDIPKNIRVEALLAFGYPDEEKNLYDEENLRYSVVFKDKYGSSYFK
jgi:nitroreductase